MGSITTLIVVHKTGGDLYFGDAMYCTLNTDTPANVLFHERIRQLEHERAISYPWWSRTGGTIPVRYVDLINTDAYFDDLIDDEWRDTLVDIYVVVPGAAFSTAELVGKLYVENITTPDTDTFRLNGYSVFEQLDKELTTKYPDTISNEQYRNQARPITLGHVRWSYPINSTLNDQFGSQRGIFDVADDYFEDIYQVLFRGAYITEVQTPLTAASQFFIIQNEDNAAATGYGFKSRGSDYRIAAEVYGQLRREATIVTSGTFPSASGGYPVDFTIEEGVGETGTISWISAGNVSISSTGVDDIYIGQTLTLTSGVFYTLEARVLSGSGVWSMFIGGTIVRSLETSFGTYCCTFQYTGGATDVRLGFVTGASGTCTFAFFQCYPVHRIDRLSEFMRFVAARTGVSTASLNLTDAVTVEDIHDLRIAYATTTEIQGGELLRKASNSYGCTFYQNNSGELTPIRFAAPAVSEDFELLEVDIAGTVEFEPDFAPGLSTRLKYDHNYNAHSEDDVLGVNAGTVAGVQLREELRHDFRVVATTETLHSMYADAEERDPLDSLLDTETDAQTLIDEICGLYTVARGFYTFRAFVTELAPHTIEPGQTVKLYYSRYGLSAGKNLLVVYAKSSFGQKAVDLVLWG